MSTDDDNSQESVELKYRDEQWLREKYIENRMEISEIAEECDVHHQTVWRWLKRHNIPRRTLSEANGGDTRLHDEDWLHSQYWENELSSREIAEKCDVGHETVLRWMRKHEIPRRSRIESLGVPEELTSRDWLHEQYVEKRRFTTEIADDLDVSHESVRNWLLKHDIPIRDLTDYTGEEHWCWEGGTVSYYGKTWREQRRKAIERDDECCVRCGLTREEHYEIYDRDLHVHHIIEASEFRRSDGLIDGSEANQLSNLLTLCFQCHSDLEGLPIDARI